jgi:hypothetical protein
LNGRRTFANPLNRSFQVTPGFMQSTRSGLFYRLAIELRKLTPTAKAAS